MKGMTAKERLIGLDVQTLQQQEEEKRLRAQEGKDEQREWDDATLAVVEQMGIIENEQQRARREMEMETRDFSLQHLSKEQRREYALSDPNVLRKDCTVRMGDHDERLGVSSVQVMAGEDLLQRERQKQQHQQQRSWIEQQIYEKQWKEQVEKHEEQEYAEDVENVVQIRTVIEHEEANVRRDINEEIANYNKRLAQDSVNGSKAMAKRKEQEANASEVEYWQNQSILNEDIATDKGATRQEKIHLMNMQREQMKENERRKSVDLAEKADDAQDQEEVRQLLLGMDYAREQETRAVREDIMAENKRLAEEQRRRKAEEKAERMNAVVNPLF